MKIEELFVGLPSWFHGASVSNYGRVISARGSELTPYVDRTTGRQKVRAYWRGAYADLFVDELVTEAFFVQYYPGIPIFYKNGNKSDCTVLNLSFDPRYKEVHVQS